MTELNLTRTEPDYHNKCVTQIMPALATGIANEIVDQSICDARAVVLVVIDGLGWHQLQRYAQKAPLLAGLKGDAPPAITTVAPSTTCAAMTAITTGATPAEHGLVGLSLQTPAGLLNPLRWTLRQPAGSSNQAASNQAASNQAASNQVSDARQLLAPEVFQPVEPFAGTRATVVTRSKYAASGFTTAHLRGASFAGWTSHRQIVPNTVAQIQSGERLVYAYYDGLDKAGHLYGLSNRYLAVLHGVDEMVRTLVAELPGDVAVLVTADHGVLEVTQPQVQLSEDVLRHTQYSSGEPRFRWLHAKPNQHDELLLAAEPYRRHGSVLTRSEVLQSGLLGPHMAPEVSKRLGDVALIAQEPVILGRLRQAVAAGRSLWDITAL